MAIHRVAAAVAQDDIPGAERHTKAIDVTVLPSERQIRYLLDLSMIAVRRNRIDEAIESILEVEQLALEQVHNHVMAQQIVAHLRNT